MNATVEQLAPVEQQATSGWVVAALYQFKEVQDPADLQQRLLDLVKTINLCGTLIVAGEGINGTVAGDRASIDQIHQFLLNEGFVEMEYKESDSSDKPFRKMKIKLKKEELSIENAQVDAEIIKSDTLIHLKYSLGEEKKEIIRHFTGL